MTAAAVTPVPRFVQTNRSTGAELADLWLLYRGWGAHVAPQRRFDAADILTGCRLAAQQSQNSDRALDGPGHRILARKLHCPPTPWAVVFRIQDL